MAASTPENLVKRRIREYLKKKRVYCFAAAAGPFSVHGVPDLICCYQGRFIGIEVKAPGKASNVTKNQRYHLDQIKANGGLAIVADNVDTVIELFDSLD